MFIQTEATPNPSTLMFLPGRPVAGDRVTEFRGREDAQASPLAAALFQINGVSQVFLGSDFVSVTKDRDEWSTLKPVVLGVLMEHFVAGLPCFQATPAAKSPMSFSIRPTRKPSMKSRN